MTTSREIEENEHKAHMDKINKPVTSATFQIASNEFTVCIDQSLIMIAANDNPFANFSVWNMEIQKAALKALGHVN